jgi:conjugal transfer ATP-binding protein TraC
MPKISPVTLRRLFHYENLPTMHSLANLWAIEENAVIGLDLSFSFVYELTLPDLTVKDEQEITDFIQHGKNFLNALPDNGVVQFWTKYSHGDGGLINEYTNTIKTSEDIGQLIINAKEKFFKQLFIQNKKNYLTITISADNTEVKKLDNKFFRVVLKDHKPITKQIHDKTIAKLKEKADLLISQLKYLGVTAKQQKEDEILKILYDQLNPGRKESIPTFNYDSEKTLRSQLFFNSSENEFDYLYLDGFYFRALNLYIRPEDANINMMMNFMSHLLPDCDLTVTVMAGNQNSMIKEVQLIDSVAKNINNVSGFRKNHEAIKKSEDAQGLLDEVKNTFQKLFFYKLSVTLKDRNLEDLTARTNKTLQLFKLIGESDAVIDDMNHLNLFLSALPNNTHLNVRKHLFQTAAIANLLPLSREWQGTKRPKQLLLTENNELLPIDLFDDSLSAKHGLILGQTGSGKSFATNYLLTNFFIESIKNHIIIIDVGGSYRKLCSVFGGQYLEIELSEKFAFNPFPNKKYAITNDSEEDFEIDTDVVSYITGLMQKMLKLHSLSGKEQKIIENAVINTYKNCKGDIPMLGDFHKELANMTTDDDNLKEIAKEYARNLNMWTTGRYGKLLNNKTALTIDNRLIVFDLQKLDTEKELQAVIFFIISSSIEEKLKDKSLKKIIVIDEGWKFFNDDAGSALIENLYRTARKFNAAIYSISQSPADFLNTKAANSIISNSYLKFVLKLKSGYDLLPNFGLNSQEIEKVKSLRVEKGKFSEIFLKFNDYNRVVKIQPSPVDYWICTTDPGDLQKELAIKEKYPDFSSAQVIEKLAQIREDEL